jgi:hypothetical protein
MVMVGLYVKGAVLRYPLNTTWCSVPSATRRREDRRGVKYCGGVELDTDHCTATQCLLHVESRDSATEVSLKLD